MRTRLLCSAALLCTLAVAGACAGEKGPTVPAEPGVLTLRLAAPGAEDGALLLSLTGPGPITEVSVAAGSPYVAHARTTGASVKVAVFGPIAGGELVRFSVPDVGKAGSYQATLLEVADRSNLLRTSTSGYTLTIAR